MGQTIKMLAFSDDGISLGMRIIENLKTVDSNIEADLHHCGEGELSEWTAKGFREAKALIFIGATGIAVRAIAPFVEKKTRDPAVLCVDDRGRFVIPLLSGHLGGANDLAEKVAEDIGAVPVITTATDARDTFAVDVFAKEMGLGIVNPEKIKAISGAVLRGNDVIVQAGEETLHLVARRYVLGVGMKKGVDEVDAMDSLEMFLDNNGIESAEIGAMASVDIKKDEPAIFALRHALGVPLRFFTAAELMEVEGEFSSSDFVREITGADNICERSAMRMAGEGAALVVKKDVYLGVTFALAKTPVVRNWEWM